MDFTKIDQADLDSPRWELSNGGLGIVVALTVFRELILCVRISDAQSSYSKWLNLCTVAKFKGNYQNSQNLQCEPNDATRNNSGS